MKASFNVYEQLKTTIIRQHPNKIKRKFNKREIMFF